jgi:hypothetical protein
MKIIVVSHVKSNNNICEYCGGFDGDHDDDCENHE